QSRAKGRARVPLAISRAILLSLLLIILADPVLTVRLTSTPRPLLYVLFDGTDSMAIEDEMSDEQRARLAAAAGLDASSSEQPEAPRLNRMQYIRALVTSQPNNLLARLSE